MMTEDERNEARANIVSRDGKADPGCKACGGCGEVWKYFKHEGEQVIDQVYDLCPVCFPDLANPILPDEGQVEITDQEFNTLFRTEGWTVS